LTSALTRLTLSRISRSFLYKAVAIRQTYPARSTPARAGHTSLADHTSIAIVLDRKLRARTSVGDKISQNRCSEELFLHFLIKEKRQA